ncbi:hypothetical protein A3K86_02505 [Photobacterium jeanii]|uniref:HTH lysR-type domain-containing protein n=1 Tax=Photobacterium jeanii TaxID=858640 RepID=A0A178KKQ5_9GAMM|nr:LysR family transcriptional regulator [Photobacterium jeanii]OAN17810.1 hypothetical protein A3K86_02505 [Photobacterium jeanii]PST92524.1 LysR family transcriptional regulator [Photobacterium jeanii]
MYHLDQLIALVTAVEAGSFSAAGRQLGKGHSTISTSINNFELTLDVQLFDRSQKYPVLTPIGEQIYAQAKLILRQNERMMAFSASKAKFEEESLEIGLDTIMPFGYFEVELEKLAAEYPHTEIHVSRSRGDSLQHQLVSGELDLAIQLNRGAVTESVDFVDLQPVIFDCVCSPDSELADMTVVDSETLMMTRQICSRDMLENPLTGIKAKFSNEIWTAADMHDVARMVEQDLGWAYLPREITQERVAMGTLSNFITDYNPDNIPARCEVDLLTAPGKVNGPALSRFIDLLRGKSVTK